LYKYLPENYFSRVKQIPDFQDFSSFFQKF
jgi:hypothetical protein